MNQMLARPAMDQRVLVHMLLFSQDQGQGFRSQQIDDSVSQAPRRAPNLHQQPPEPTSEPARDPSPLDQESPGLTESGQ